MYKEYIIRIFENGDKEWYNKFGQLHREEGAAVEFIDGKREYWVNGHQYTETEYIDYLVSLKRLIKENENE